MGFGAMTVLAVRENYGHFCSCPSNLGSACHWLILHTETASQRKRNLHQTGDLAMTLWTNNICGGVFLYHCFLPKGPSASNRNSYLPSQSEGLPSVIEISALIISFLPTDPHPVTWSVTIQLPVLPPSPAFLKINLQQAEVRSQVFPVAPPDSGS